MKPTQVIKKLDYIDALRGLAILAVIMVHIPHHGLPPMIEKIVSGGLRGVQLFYIASAFTLFLSFKNRLPKEHFPIRNFFLRRLFRIAPMYYVGIGYYLFQDGFGSRFWLGDATHITSLNILSNITFLHGFNPYWINSIVPGGWSIGVEMLFYLILPFLFSKIKNINDAFIFFIISLFLKLCLHLFFQKFHLISDDTLWDAYLFFYLPSQLPVFSLGIFLYFMIIENESIKNISGISILIFSCLLLLRLSIESQLILPNHILYGMSFLILTYALSIYKPIFIVNPIINYIGKISFSMYLVHFAVLHWLAVFNFNDYFENGLLNYVLRFGLVTFLSVLFSTIFYQIIEQPFQNLGKRIIDRMEK